MKSMRILTACFALFFCLGIIMQAADPAPDDLGSLSLLLKTKWITWVFIGDSITHGALHTDGWRSYPELFAERVRWEMRRYQDVVINTGISGDNVIGALKGIDYRVLRFKPGVVSIMYGINDNGAGEAGRAAFRTNLVEFLQLVRKSGAIPILNTPNPMLAPEVRRQDLPAYVQIIREVAGQEKVILVDHYDHWQKVKPNSRELSAWMNDNIHPNYMGHREFANEIFRVIGIYATNSPTCQLPVK